MPVRFASYDSIKAAKTFVFSLMTYEWRRRAWVWMKRGEEQRARTAIVVVYVLGELHSDSSCYLFDEMTHRLPPAGERHIASPNQQHKANSVGECSKTQLIALIPARVATTNGAHASREGGNHIRDSRRVSVQMGRREGRREG